VGAAGLALGPQDGGADPDHPVVWRSADPSNPAVVGAPIRIPGPWEPHASIKGALVAGLAASNLSKGATLRHFWVDGARATRPTVFACSAGPSGRGVDRVYYPIAVSVPGLQKNSTPYRYHL
jgi:hypothetical protein